MKKKILKTCLLVFGCVWFLAVNIFLVLLGKALLHEHTWVFVDGQKVTCQQVGFKRYVCDCGEEKTQLTAILEHTLYTIEEKEANCQETGWKEYQKCVNCTFSTYEPIAISEHIWKERDGILVCEHCQAEKTEEKTEHVHTYENISITKDPTCTQNGTALYTCDCGETGIVSVSKLGHKKGNGNCLSGFLCQRCDYLYILPKPHDYRNGVCRVCGDIKSIASENNSSSDSSNSSSDSSNSSSDSSSSSDVENEPQEPTPNENVLEFEEIINIGYSGYMCVGFLEGESCESVIIPDTYNGKAVIGIKKGAFKNDKNVKEVRIGENIQVIEADAFFGCTNLKTVYNGSRLEIEIGTAGNGCIGAYAEEIIVSR